MKTSILLSCFIFAYSGAIAQKNLINDGSVDRLYYDTTKKFKDDIRFKQFLIFKNPCYTIKGMRYIDYYYPGIISGYLINDTLLGNVVIDHWTSWNLVFNSENNVKPKVWRINSPWSNPDSVASIYGTFLPTLTPFYNSTQCKVPVPYNSISVYINTLNTQDTFFLGYNKQHLMNYFDLVTDDNFIVNNHPGIRVWDMDMGAATFGVPHLLPDKLKENMRNKRSYITNRLLESLIPGQKYKMSFFVRTKDYVGDTFYTNKNVPNNSFYSASDGLGIAFSTFKPKQHCSNVLPLKTVWSCPDIINFKNGIWKQYTFEFIADSAFQFMTIGNFKRNSELNVKEPVWYPANPVLYKDYIWHDKGRTSSFMYDSFTLVLMPDTPLISGPSKLCQGQKGRYRSASRTAPTEWYYQGNSVAFARDSSISISPDSSVWLKAYNGIIWDSTFIQIDKMPVSNMANKSIHLCFGKDSTICPVVYPSTTQYLWPNGSEASCYTFSKPGTSLLVLKNGLCVKSDSFMVNLLPLPDFKILQSDTPCLNGAAFTRLLITPDTFSNVQWLPSGEYQTQIQARDTTAVYALVTGSNACGKTLSYKPQSICKMLIYIPNCFTPNTDDVNETFKVQGYNMDKLEMSIYNRWGELIFYTDNKDLGWDGTYKNKLVPDGNYLVKLKALSAPGLNGITPIEYYTVILQVLK